MGEGIVHRISGPIIVSRDTEDLIMNEEVRIGDEQLIGEIIEISGDNAVIQVYEDTTGIKPGTKIFGTGNLLSVELGPGLIGNTFDGIQRPLTEIKNQQGTFIKRGVKSKPLSREKEWKVDIKVSEGDRIESNSIIGEVEETPLIKHRIPVPPGISGKIVKIYNSESYKIEDNLCTVRDDEGNENTLKLFHTWPVRKKRPFNKRLPPEDILFTGQRVIDFIFPISRGGH